MESNKNRKLGKAEIMLVNYLAAKANEGIFPLEKQDSILVEPIQTENDIGSLLIFFDLADKKKWENEPMLMVSELEFTDVDGVRVIATLYTTENRKLFELDLWKVDFSPIVQIPENLQSLIN